MAVGGQERPPFLLSTVKTAKNGGHLLRVLFLLLVLGPLWIQIRILLRPIIIFLLDGEAVNVVGVHDMLDSFVVVKDGQSRHFVKVGQVLIVAVTTLDELITGVLQGCPLQGLVTHHARLALLVSLLGPVGTLSIVKVLRDAEFSMKYFALFINLVLKYVLTSQIVVVIVHGEHVVLDCLLRDLLVGWHEILFISFA